MKSCIYQGQVRHRRFSPRPHAFNYSLYLMYLDLAELPDLFKPFWLWSNGRFNMASFWRKDHAGDPARSLDDVIRERIQQHTGRRPQGPIRLLTHLRYLGFGFNPVSFYYCFDAQDKKLETIVCEVNNTPWGEQHLYVLSEQDRSEQNISGEDELKSSRMQFKRSKEFHVSPFMPMDIQYDWRFAVPDEHLYLHMQNFQQDKKLFDATMNLDKIPISSSSLARVLIGFPLVTVKVVIGIYYEAMRLWLKKVPFYSHPEINEASKPASRL